MFGIKLLCVTGCLLARGGGVVERDGSDGSSVRGHAGAELAPHPTAAGEGRRELQTHDGEDQVQPAAQAGSRGEGCTEGTGEGNRGEQV